MMFSEREISYLHTQRLGRLATMQRNGTIQVSPVSVYYNPDLETIDIGGRNMAASQKFKNVAANERVAVIVDDMPSYQPLVVRCIEIRGRGEALTEPRDSHATVVGPIIRVHPERIISFGIDPDGPGKRDVQRRHS